MQSSEQTITRSLRLALLSMFICALAPAFAMAAGGLPEPDTVVVTSERGNCVRISDHKHLEAGDILHRGESFKFEAPRSPTDYLDVMLESGEVVAYDCDKRLPCLVAHSAPVGTKHNALVSDLLRAKRFFFPIEEKTTYFSTNGIALPLREAVLPLNGDKVDMARLLLDMEEGDYTFWFDAPRTGAIALVRTAPQKFTAKWAWAGPRSAQIGPIKPGLYEVRTSGPTDRNFWILVVEPGDYARLSAGFQRALDLTGTWNGKVKPQSVHNFLRAYLSHLSGSHAIEASR